jgi:hypothetical protein
VGPKDCPETSVRNYNYTLRNSPEKCSSHKFHGGSLKSCRKKLSPVDSLIFCISCKKIYVKNIMVHIIHFVVSHTERLLDEYSGLLKCYFVLIGKYESLNLSLYLSETVKRCMKFGYLKPACRGEYPEGRKRN